MYVLCNIDLCRSKHCRGKFKPIVFNTYLFSLVDKDRREFLIGLVFLWFVAKGGKIQIHSRQEKKSSYISFLQEFQGTLEFCSLWFLNGDNEIVSCYLTISFGLIFFKFSDPLWRKWKKNHSGIPFSYLRKRRQSLLFDFPNNFIFMKLEAFFNIEFWNSNSNQNQIGWSGRVQWQIIFHLLSLCIQGDCALMLVIWK